MTMDMGDGFLHVFSFGTSSVHHRLWINRAHPLGRYWALMLIYLKSLMLGNWCLSLQGSCWARDTWFTEILPERLYRQGRDWQHSGRGTRGLKECIKVPERCWLT
ncbi:hypothetical protein J6590_067954 [Homalodisca vitripennis]|nr:hypothetical protein J6590_067954 [Homalodisca vitripennis]